MSDLVLGFPGQQITQIPATFISRTASETIEAGQPVFRDATDGATKQNNAKVATSATGFLGICATGAQKGQSIRIMTEGAIVVEVSGAVAAGDQATFGGDSKWGKSKTYKLTAGVFDTTTSGAGLTIIRMANAIAST